MLFLTSCTLVPYFFIRNKLSSPFIFVEDMLWKFQRKRSESFGESNNNYCLINRRNEDDGIYNEVQKAGYIGNEYYKISNKEKFEMDTFLKKKNYDREKLGLQIAGFLENKNINIKREYIKQSTAMSYYENMIFIEKIKEEVKKSNYKDCDFLILYGIHNYENAFDISTTVNVVVFDVRIDSNVSWYSLRGIITTYYYGGRIPFLEDFFDEALNKWWEEYQTNMEEYSVPNYKYW
jgi:hypothetical protein